MLALEIYIIAYRVDITIAIRDTINIIIERLSLSKVLVIVYIDSRSLYDYLVKLRTTKEKRLIINIIALREVYKRSELIDI